MSRRKNLDKGRRKARTAAERIARRERQLERESIRRARALREK